MDGHKNDASRTDARVGCRLKGEGGGTLSVSPAASTAAIASAPRASLISQPIARAPRPPAAATSVRPSPQPVVIERVSILLAHFHKSSHTVCALLPLLWFWGACPRYAAVVAAAGPMSATTSVAVTPARSSAFCSTKSGVECSVAFGASICARRVVSPVVRTLPRPASPAGSPDLLWLALDARPPTTEDHTSHRHHRTEDRSRAVVSGFKVGRPAGGYL